MSETMKIIKKSNNKLNNILQNLNNTDNLQNKIIIKIKKKWKHELESFTYISEIKNIKVGQILAYSPINLDYLYKCIVIDIDINNNYITIKDIYKNNIFRMNITKYYVFTKDSKMKILLDTVT